MLQPHICQRILLPNGLFVDSRQHLQQCNKHSGPVFPCCAMDKTWPGVGRGQVTEDDSVGSGGSEQDVSIGFDETFGTRTSVLLISQRDLFRSVILVCKDGSPSADHAILGIRVRSVDLHALPLGAIALDFRGGAKVEDVLNAYEEVRVVS